jgi:hypothetical protein
LSAPLLRKDAALARALGGASPEALAAGGSGVTVSSGRRRFLARRGQREATYRQGPGIPAAEVARARGRVFFFCETAQHVFKKDLRMMFILPFPQPHHEPSLCFRTISLVVCKVAALEAGGVHFADVLTLAVVGHGAMIRKHCMGDAVAAESAEANCSASGNVCSSSSSAKALRGSQVEPTVRANNNAVYEKLFVVEITDSASSGGGVRTGAGEGPSSSQSKYKSRPRSIGTMTMLREVLGDCRLVMDAPTRQQAMKSPQARDLASCTLPFDVRPFLMLWPSSSSSSSSSPLFSFSSARSGRGGSSEVGQEGGPASRQVTTPCEAAADVPGAYPIQY